MSAYEKSAQNTKTKAETEGNTTPKMLRLFALYENLTRFVMPLCTALTDRENPRTPITQSNNIVDISGVGLKQFWNLRGHMQDASTLATAHYPETLDRIFVRVSSQAHIFSLLYNSLSSSPVKANKSQIIGAPAFFPTVWGWIKKWFDPITTSKIFILGHHDMKTTLESFIDPINIPKKYGGSLDFEFGQMPLLDPALSKVLKWEGEYTDFPKGPMYWTSTGETDKIEALAVGSIDEKQRKEKVCMVTREKELDIPAPIAINGHAESPKLELAPPTLPSAMLEAPTVPVTPVTEKTDPLTREPELEKATEGLMLEKKAETAVPNGGAVGAN